MDGEHAAECSHAGRLGAGDDLRLGIEATGRGLLREFSARDLLLQRAQLATARLRACHEFVKGGQGGSGACRRNGDDLLRAGIGEECRQRRPGRGSSHDDRRSIRFDVQRFALGAKAIESGGIARGLALRDRRGDLPDAGDRDAELTLAALFRDEVCERQTNIGARATNLLVGPARDPIGPGRCGADGETAPAGDRKHLPNRRDVLGDAGRRLPVDDESWIGPSRRCLSIRACHIDRGADRLDTGALWRQARQRLGLGQRQRLCARGHRHEAPWRSRRARSTCA